MTPEPSGSSPLTRGKLTDLIPALAGIRLIPAHAGKTKRSDHTDPGPAAHPRSRGENVRARFFEGLYRGSSPLTRGKHRRRCPHGAAGGLIPAHAGKTTVAALALHGNAAHPRSRGENLGSTFGRDNPEGSSPLTRGKPLPPRCRHIHRRLIPAHAGKTASDRPFLACFPAHPRSRGENFE